MKKLALVLLACAAVVSTRAETYVHQADFATRFSTVTAMDTDALGNLYLLGLASGSTTYQVRSYGMPGFAPLFSFDTKVSSPGAFAVESSGVIDVFETKGALALKRFSNVGQLVSLSTYSIQGSTPFASYTLLPPILVSAAIDKVNARVYLGYQYTQTGLFCFSVIGNCTPVPISTTQSAINQYDFGGNELLNIPLSGGYWTLNGTSWSSGCYAPTRLAADPQGTLYVADGSCQEALSFSPVGAQVSTFTLSGFPAALWTDPAANVYVSEPICSPSGCPYGVARFSSTGVPQTSFAVGLTAADARDSRILYTASGGALTRWIYDAPPSVPAETAPTGSLLQHSSTVTFSWQASADSDADPVTYGLYIGTATNALALAVSTSQAGAALSLPFGTTYYWLVVAQDSYMGVPVLQSSAPVVSFNLNLLDQPPAAVQVSMPPVVTTMRGSAAVSWQAVTTPLGDPVSYTLYFGDSGAGLAPIAQVAASTTAGAGTATLTPLAVQPQTQAQVNGSTITVSLAGLVYNRSYFVQVQAADPYGATSITPVQSFSLASVSGFPAAYNYPNPFSPNHGGTNIVFNAPASGFAKATVEVYSEWQDLLFKQDYFNIPPGVSQVAFKGQDRYGRAFFNGSYICRVKFSGPDQQVIFYMAVAK